ncbi:unnamed protein product [Schistosoma mattheei]|uniref:Uncharacterized protein n=1 Tax=Schistosoma mattheei TaxID=31246 RepID=A0A183NNK9_9TREM|nr:unnamed protein product [Schistosoma mattheei]
MNKLNEHYTVDDASLEEIWLQFLPNVARRILCASGQPLGLENLPGMADKILEITCGTIPYVQITSHSE